MKTCKDCVHCDVCNYKNIINGTTINNPEIAETCTFFACKDLYIKLPCNIGDTVFAVRGCFYIPHETKINANDFIPCEIIGAKKVKKGNFLLLKPLIKEVFNKRSANQWFAFSCIGITVFLTKEDAALKWRSNNELH